MAGCTMKTTMLVCNGSVVIPHVELATRWWQRMRGLLGRSGLSTGRALYISPANSIHMFFMRFTLDLIFVDRDGVVVRIVRNLRPWRMAFGGRTAQSVFEISAGWLDEDAVRVGDRLVLAVNQARPAPD